VFYQLLDKKVTKFKRLHPYFGVKLYNGVDLETARPDRKWENKFTMEVATLEILIPQRVHTIESKFRWLYLCFRYPDTMGLL